MNVIAEKCNVTEELIIFFGCARHELEAALARTAGMEFGEALEETVRTMGLRQLKSKRVAKFGYILHTHGPPETTMLLGVHGADQPEPTCIECTERKFLSIYSF